MHELSISQVWVPNPFESMELTFYLKEIQTRKRSSLMCITNITVFKFLLIKLLWNHKILKVFTIRNILSIIDVFFFLAHSINLIN